MAVIRTAELISVTDANELGVSRLVREAENGQRRVVLRNNKPVAVVVGIDEYEATQDLEETLEDLALVLARSLTSSSRRVPLDEVLDRFGYTREELLALAEE